MIKTLKKVVAVVLTLAMLLSIASVPISADTLDSLADNTNGKTIDLTGVISSDDAGEDSITSASAGDTFYMNVNFANNPTTTPITICAYTLVMKYDPAKVSVSTSWEMDAATLLNNEYSVEGTLLATWAGAKGITSRNKILAEGTFFTVEFVALQDLTEDDLAKIKPIDKVDSVDENGVAVKAETEFFDQNNGLFAYNWVPTLEEAPAATEIKESDFTFDIDPDGYEYTGSAITPAVTSNLTAGTDYEVAYANNTEVGTATITVTGKGKYTGTITKTFTIKAKEGTDDTTNGKTIDLTGVISSDDAGENSITSASAGDTFYMNVNFANNPTTTPVTICAYTLVMNYDPAKVSVSSSWEMDAATLLNNEYSVEGTLLATWAGAKGITSRNKILAEGTFFTVEFVALQDLTEDDLAKIKPIDKVDSVDKNGVAVKAETEFFDQNNGLFAYNWIPTLEEKPAATEISDADFTFDLADKTYTGSAIDGLVSSTKLTAGTDYDVTYADNTNVGKATITVTGKGNYTGTVTKTFVIVAKAIQESDFTFDLTDKTYTGSAIDGLVSSTLSADAYDVKYDDNTEIGQATITVTGKGNYTGEIVKNFNIVARAISDADFTFDLADKVYTGSAIEPKVTSSLAADAYEVAYSANTAVGQATITVTGKGKYTGKIVKNFNITAKAISDADFTFDLADKEHTGSAIEPAVTSAILTAGKDFDVAYTNNTNIGTATITVTGKGNYSGTITKTFEIIDPSTLDDIVLSIAFTNAESEGYGDDAKITSVEAGKKFWMWINFSNNFTEKDKTAIAYDLLIAYNKDKIRLETDHAGLTSPTGNLNFTDGVAFLQWADTEGIRSFAAIPPQVQSEGTLFVIEATAKETLSARDLRDITIMDKASAQVGSETRDKKTVFYNIHEKVIDYIFKPTLDIGVEIKESDFEIDLSDKEYTGEYIEPSVTSETLEKGTDYIVTYAHNKDAGPATITIKGFGEYVGTIQRTFKINPKPISESKFTFDLATRTYTGEAFKPTVTSSLPVDAYDVAYANNTEVGTATITVSGKGNYTGTVIKSFTIVPRAITNDDFTFDLADKTYTGEEIKPAVESELIEGIDYEVAYTSNTTVGTATIVVTGEGNYKGTITKTFAIVPKPLEDADFEFDLADKTYTGSAINPDVAPLTGLAVDTDYVVAYGENTNVGDGTITVTGKGNYTGTLNKTFNIVAKAIEDSDFTFDLADKDYTGVEIKPEVTSTLTEADFDVTYTNNVQKGDATITVTGKGNYKGEIVKTFKIVTRAIKEADFIFDLINKTYTGEEIKPDVTSTLIAGTDYEVVYTDNVEVGTATITVTGKEPNCAGTIVKNFEITAKTITEADFEFDLDDKEYTSKEIKPDVTPLTGLTAGTDYDVVYSDNINVGTATITVVGKDNYAGRIEKTFDITPREIKDGDFTFDLEDKTYTGSAIEPEVTSTLADGDYEVTYTDNVNAGTATITVTGKGPNCTGEIVKTFTINPRPISDDDFIFDLVNKVYTGEAIEPEVESELVEGTDYEVAYTDNTEKGTATITVTGKAPNCTGDIVKTFKIVAEAIEDSDFTIDDADKVYTGSAIEPEVTSALVEGTDYEVIYVDNVEVGTATIIINGIGDEYGGTIKKTFNITQKAITDADFTLDPTSYVYTGSEIKPDVTSTLAAGTDYEVTYSDNTNVGTATITIKGIGNYSGEVGKTFEITKKTISDADFTVDLSDKVYTGSEIKPKVTSTLAAGTDYDVAYTSNIEVGTATITVTAKGNNSTGTATFNFDIVARVITEADFTVDLSDKVYTGEEIKPEVTSALADGDYVVTYKNNVEVGTATITIEGKGPNCKGWVSLTFKIVEKYAPTVGGGGGGGSATYSISIPEVEGGKVTSSHNTAKAGHTVTITATPDEGYVLSEVTVVDKSGKEIAVTKDGEGYKFVMPSNSVEVKAIFTNGEDGDGFTDVKPGAYYYDAVNWAVDAGITNGMSASLFGSNFDCTRAQMVTFLWRAAGCPKPMTTESDFVDIVKGSYYYDAVLWAEENGITIGTSATTFSPDDNVTRGQTVTFFWRMENKPTAEVNVEFTDVAADAYYYDAVAWAVEEEITNGVSATEFAPNDMCKREQIVTFLYRFFVK